MNLYKNTENQRKYYAWVSALTKSQMKIIMKIVKKFYCNMQKYRNLDKNLSKISLKCDI